MQLVRAQPHDAAWSQDDRINSHATHNIVTGSGLMFLALIDLELLCIGDINSKLPLQLLAAS